MKRTPLKRKTPLKPSASKPRKRKGKTKRAKLIERADVAWALLCKHRAGFRCEYEGCGKPVHLHAHHVRSRRYRRLRWSLANACCLCFQHHLQFAHRDPLAFASWFRTYRFEDYSEIMRAESVAPIQLSDAALEQIARELEAQVAEYEAKAA